MQESGEMYLETIYRLGREMPSVRSVDIATRMGFSKPTISAQLKKFRKEGYVRVDENGFVTLTAKGEDIARRTYERHVVITRILTTIGVSKKTAEEDACRIEHYISKETFDCMKNYYGKVLEEEQKS